MSTRPGATTQPSASSTSAPADGARPGADLGDHAVDDAHVGDPLAGLVDDAAAREERPQTTGPPDPSSDHSTAMRTATPFATCSVTSERRGVGDLAGDLDAAVHRARDASRACRA